MKFFYTPNCHVIDYEKMKEVFVFDEKGEFETDDPKLIAWIRKYKNFIRYEETNTNKEPVKEETKEKEEDIKNIKRICKQCGQEFDNAGKYLAHIKQHKKAGD